MNTAAWLLLQIGTYSAFGGLLIFLPITWATTTRYFDNTLGFKSKFYNPAIRFKYFPSFIMPTLQYAVLIVFKKAAKKSYNRLVFGDINFRNQARKIDVIMSFILLGFVYSGAAIILIGVVLNIIDKLLI